MIRGIGIDLVSTARIHALREKHGEHFLDRIFTEAEKAEALGRKEPDEALASRFAAKEAAMKALGTGWAEGVGWRDVEVVRPVVGPPELHFSGGAAARAKALGVTAAHVSLTHDGGMAAAVVVLEGEGGRRP